MSRLNVPRFQAAIDTIAMVVLAAAVGKMAFNTSLKSQPARPANKSASAPLPTTPVSLGGAQLQGSRSAGVALLVYSDFECPYCAKFARETFPVLIDKYVRPGKLLVGFRHYPLPIHRFAERAAEIAECVGQQGKFWPFHDRVFLAGAQLSEERLRAEAAGVGANAASVDRCLSTGARQAVAVARDSGNVLGVTGTPTFFLGRVQGDSVVITERFAGALPLEQFEAALARAGLK